MKKKTLSIPEQIEKETQYVEFLKKRLASKNFKSNVSTEEYEATRIKYDKAKFKLKTLQIGRKSNNV